MTKLGLIVLTLVMPLVLSGCSRRGTSSVPDKPGDTRLRLQVGQRQLKAMVAYNNTARQRGLMYRKALEEDEGMLFVFPRKKVQSFWMKNTLIPLSIAYIDDSGKVLQIEEMAPRDETSVRSDSLVRYALEVKRGWYRKAGLREGDSLPDFRAKVAPYLKIAN